MRTQKGGFELREMRETGTLDALWGKISYPFICIWIWLNLLKIIIHVKNREKTYSKLKINRQTNLTRERSTKVITRQSTKTTQEKNNTRED